MRLFCFAVLAFCGPFVSAQGVRQLFLPDTAYDERVPSMQAVHGFDFGQRISMHHEAFAFVKALAGASDRVSYRVHGKTWQGREMVLVFVTSARNQARLPDLKRAYAKLADPDLSAPQGQALEPEDLPVLVWLSQSVHGNEPSGVDSGLFLSWHLAAAKDDATQALLENAVVVIEMMQNPDGRDRFISYSRNHRGFFPNSEHWAAERQEDWPEGRPNHYLFDMNRDWFAMTQPETQAKVAAILAWHPQVVVDLHEMGENTTYFAANPAKPLNPALAPRQIAAFKAFGQAIGKALDARGIAYFQGEAFDSFYPGYGEAWPSLQGAIGMLLEQGSPRGLVLERRDGVVVRYEDAVRNHTVASYAILRHAADERLRVLKDYRSNRAEAKAGPPEINERHVLLLPGDDPSRAVALGRLLQRQGIQVRQLTSSRTVQARPAGERDIRRLEVPAGTLWVSLQQPSSRLAWSLLMDHISMDEDFLKRQNELYASREPNEIYDLTGWSLPLCYGVDALYMEGNLKAEAIEDLQVPVQRETDAKLAYMVPYRGFVGPFLAQLLRQDIRVYYSSLEMAYQGEMLPPGSLIIPLRGNPSDLAQRLQGLAEKHEVSLLAADSAWFEKGPSFGSSKVHFIKPPALAMLWHLPTKSLSAGWMRYAIEQQIGYPVTALKGDRLARVPLERYDVLFIPDVNPRVLSRYFGPAEIAALDVFVRQGGVLVTVGEATSWLADPEHDLLNTVLEAKGGSVMEDSQQVEHHPAKPIRNPDEMLEPVMEAPRELDGALVKVTFDQSHWLAFGLGSEGNVLVGSNRMFRPLRLDQGTNVGRFAAKDVLLRAGFVDDKSVSQLAHKSFAMVQNHGKGLLIAFSEDPNYRGFMHGLVPLMVNAAFFSEAQTTIYVD